MEKSWLDLEQTIKMFVHVSHKMEAEKDHLTKLDQAIGDADHGIGMARGFEAVRNALPEASFDSIGAVLKKIGTVLMMSVGGASGAIFGTLFRGGAVNLMTENRFNSSSLSNFLKDGMAAVKERGGAKEGDKTMLDALVPAATKSSELLDAPLCQSLIAVSEAAREGMEKTKDMLAKTGKAKTMGNRAIGHIDPGAVTTYLILKHMMNFTTIIESIQKEKSVK